MTEGVPSFPKIRLTKLETTQTEKRVFDLNEEQRTIEFFQQNQEIRERLLARPFSSSTQETIKEIPTPANIYSILRCAILSEPDGAYEQAFHKLPREEQRKKLYNQIDSSAEMTIKIQKYIEENIEQINTMSEEDLYQTLCKIAFETSEEDTIQAKCPLLQRRGFKFSIVNFLETKASLSTYRTEALTDPKGFAEKYLEQKFTGNITIEQLPIGLIIYLDENDYALFDNGGESINSKSDGKTLFWRSLPLDLKGKIVVINKGGRETGIRTQEELASTRRHEVTHIIFSEFHEQHNKLNLGEVTELSSKCQSEKDYQNLSDLLFEDYVEKAKDEIIAYFSGGTFDESYFDLRFHQYDWSIERLEESLNEKENMPIEMRLKISNIFANNKKKCFETIRKMRLVAESMYKQPGNKYIEIFLNKLGLKKNSKSQNDISEALLRNTYGTKIHRLAKYAGLTEDDIKSEKIIKEKNQQVVYNLSNLLTLPESFDEKYWDRIAKAIQEIKKYMPIEILPVLLNAISEWSKVEWSSFWIEQAISLVEDLIKLPYGVPIDTEKVKQVMDDFISQRAGVKKFEKSIELAQKSLDLLE